MPYGLITEEMEPFLTNLVVGEEVWDLGAGDMGHARHLLRMGAAGIVAVDKEYQSRPHAFPGIRAVKGYFSDLVVPESGIKIAFVAWPVNYRAAAWDLSRILARVETVIYLGSNMNGSACGTPELFQSLTGRKLLAHVHHRRNTLLVYGTGERVQPLTREEHAATTGELLYD